MNRTITVNLIYDFLTWMRKLQRGV